MKGGGEGNHKGSMHGHSASMVSGMLMKDERNVEDAMEVNDMLVDAIKAKLAILDNIH